MNEKINVGMTKVDLFNARNASRDVKEAINAGEVLTVTGCAIIENGGTDKQGNPCDIGYIATTAGVFGFISNIMIGALDFFADILTDNISDGKETHIVFHAATSKGGSEYYNFEIVQ